MPRTWSDGGRRVAPGAVLAALSLATLALAALALAALASARPATADDGATGAGAPGTFTLRSARRGPGRPTEVVLGTLVVRAAGDGLEVERAVRPEAGGPTTTWVGRGALAGLTLRVDLGPPPGPDGAPAAPVASATYVFTPDGLEADEVLEPEAAAGDGGAAAPGWTRADGRAVRAGPRPAPGPTRRVVVVAGREVPIAAEVVTWRDPGGFDAYRPTGSFRPDRALPTSPAAGCDTPERYAPRRLVDAAGAPAPATPEAVAAHVRQVVVHYDVCWTSRECFRVLHDQRGLSCHFLLDVDGTLYQTLDVADRARHAGAANDRSVGVEVAHPGALELDPALAAAYRRDADGPYLDLGWRAGHVRTPGFVPRPARPEPVAGRIHGAAYTQWDFTAAQYEALAALLAALQGALPALRLEAPRDADGRVRTGVLAPAELEAFAGVLGHWHVTTAKQDPGPAFDWDRVLTRARALAGRR